MDALMTGRGAAIVTGAARRIGRAIALELGRAGFSVAVHHGSSPEDARGVVVEIVRAGGKAVAIQADLADAAALSSLLDRTVEALGHVTCLVNNASVFRDDRLETVEAGNWDSQLDVNLRAPILLSRMMAERLPAPIRGNIVNVIDQRVLRPTPEYFSYAVSKAGLYTATRMMAQALAPRIRVNGVGPGPVLKNVFQSDAEFAEEAGSTLLGYGATPEEIASTVRFLLDQPAITGQMIAVDGGQHLLWKSCGGLESGG